MSSVPISYDSQTGLVQADAVNFATGAVEINGDNNVSTTVTTDQDYPSFVSIKVIQCCLISGLVWVCICISLQH